MNMPTRSVYSIIALLLALILSACGTTTTPTSAPTELPAPTSAPTEPPAPTAAPTEPPAPTAAPTEPPAPTSVPTELPAPTSVPTEPPVPTSAPTANLPAWQTVTLNDVRTGQNFTLADFIGRPVYVEAMATWCPKCREQLGNVQAAAQQFGADGPVFVAISVETELAAADLARYADENGFTMIFAVATPEALRALADGFGWTITNPPATPQFLINANGTAGALQTGTKSPEEIVALIAAAQ